MSDGGFDFRNTSGYVTDPANCTYVLLETSATRGGFTFGWDQVANNVGVSDRNSGTDARLAGVFIDYGPPVSTFTVSSGFSAGTYNIDLALGDYSYTHANLKAEFFDNTTSLFAVSGSTSGSNRFLDATGVARTPSGWVSSHALKTSQSFASSTFVVKIGDGTNTSTIAHVRWTTSGGATHTTTGALTGPGASVSGTAHHKAIHATSGAVTGAGSTVVGSASRTRVHTSTGALTGPGASIAGTAARTRVHSTTGALTGSGASVAGTAHRTRVHSTTGALTGTGATVVGTAHHKAIHVTSGSLAGPGTSVVGTAHRTAIHATSGTLIGPGSTVAGVAAHKATHATSGVLAGAGALVVGVVVHTGAGATGGGGGLFVGSKIQPPPTWALPIVVDESTKQASFNPVWLKWFVDLSTTLSNLNKK
jgi:hypothetical protein